jgi:hypothetical protein
MLILDSNVWIYVATAEEFPVEIYSNELRERLYFFEEFYEGRQQTVLSAYMLEEIRQGLFRSKRVSEAEIEDILTKLFTLIHSCEDVLVPFNQAQLKDVDLSEVRGRTDNRLLAQLLDIQAKDVPILSLAYEHRTERPLILTDDGGFSDLSPPAVGLPNITIEGLSLTW